MAERRGIASLALVFSLLLGHRGQAEGTSVPADLQVELLSKLSLHDRSFTARAGDQARLVILVKSGSTRSDVSASGIKAALARLDRFGGLPHTETIVAFENAPALARRCQGDHVAVVYVTPGLESEIERLRSAMTGVDVLTVAALPDYVQAGVVLGFELLSGKPKMIINYEQAKQQNVNFAADVLKLMRVVSK